MFYLLKNFLPALSRDTIRYYEKISLISPPQRDINGYKIYTKINLKEIRFISSEKNWALH
ncbi:MerR family DNA-binding transcriptional regulator [Halobacteriovorax sp. DA5]|uniref:MerR family DNA-binding transcriptional regulator n=1 Tax=Halobacteriovorax sp. DA5 TaxID=2067553 RepID=UPI000CD208AF|nr:hypothetical protein C0Z22_01840 [Halobacteriovorax sp. DA5]